MPAQALLRFDRATARLGGREVISRFSLQVSRGEFVCIVGPSGCGKTTLLRMAAGLQLPHEGAVLRKGVAVARPSREVALVFQDYGRALLPWRSVAGNVGLALEAAGLARAAKAGRVREVLAKVGLDAHAQRFPAQLSGGMQQRVQIARCLAQQPELLLMDEPFGALDALTRQGLQDEVARLVRDEGLTVVFVTHDLEEAIYLGDRVLVLRQVREGGDESLARMIEVGIPRPRDQLRTREDPAFLRLRHELFAHVGQGRG